jgi:hypothetical protein
MTRKENLSWEDLGELMFYERNYCYKIDGVLCVGEQAIRDYCFNYVEKGFKQDYRLASQAYRLPVIQLIAMLEATGHTVEEAPQPKTV